METGISARVKMIPEPPRWVRFPAQAVCTVNGIANVGWRLRHAWQYAYEAGWYRAISAPRMNRRAAFFYAYEQIECKINTILTGDYRISLQSVCHRRDIFVK